VDLESNEELEVILIAVVLYAYEKAFGSIATIEKFQAAAETVEDGASDPQIAKLRLKLGLIGPGSCPNLVQTCSELRRHCPC